MEKKVIKSFVDLELPSVVKASDEATKKLQDPKSKGLIFTAGAKPTASVSDQLAHPSPQPPKQIQAPIVKRTVGEEDRNAPHIAKETKRLEELARTLEQRQSKLALDQAKIAKERENLNAEKLALQNRTNQVIANQRDSSEKEKANNKRSEELDRREVIIINAEPDALSRLAKIKQKELELEKLMAEALRPETEFKELQTALAKVQIEFERKCDEVSKLTKTNEANKLLQKKASVLESDLQQSRFALSAVEESHAKSLRQVKELSDDLAAAYSNLKALQTKLQDQNILLADVQSEIDRLSRFEVENQSLRVSIKKIEADLEENRFALLAEEESHTVSQKEVKELNEDLAAANIKLKALQTKFRDQNILLTDVQSERDRLSRFEVENRSLRVSIKKVEAESVAMKKKVDDLVRAVAVRSRAVPSSPAKVVESATPFAINSMAVLGWLSSAVLDAFQPPDDVVSIGSGPLPEDEFDDYLRTLGITPYPSRYNWVIVGRTGWTPQQLEELIEGADPGELRIFSQELFIAGQLSTHDPFSADPELLMEFAKGHPALEYLIGSGFEWPIIEELEELGVPQYVRGSYNGVDESPIYRMGYVVGITNGLSLRERQKLLTRAFEGVIPNVGDADYMAEWGTPNTRDRLWRIAHHLAWLIRSRRRNPVMEYAVDDWANDLDWLESTFYKSRMKFSWPNV
jgi:hypothetical protein